MASGLPWTLKPEQASQGRSLFSTIRKLGRKSNSAYISVLLNLSRSYLTNDDSLFGRMIHGTNDKRNYGEDTEDKEHHQFMLRMYFGAITAHVENPFSIDDQSSEDDTSKDDASEDDASEDDASEDDASEDDIK
ncbi:hypothetical protein BDZ45DRAFT_754647 [Acephala macrosclerotiorum]|nr:hypothetical protein BDZ45DRAFT_754647 [Acephala macrosclerotiorum]